MNIKNITIILILISSSIWAQTDKKLKKTIRSAAEQVITKKGFTILDLKIQNEALKEQNKNIEDSCLDDACLIDTGKMLAAQRVFIIRISKLGENQYLFKIIHTNLETDEMIASQSEVFLGKLTDYNKLFQFGQKFFSTIFYDDKTNYSMTNKIPAMLETILDLDFKKEVDGKKFILSIKTNPEGVNIFNGNKLIGISPLSLQMPTGNYNLVFQKDGYDRMEKKVELFKDSQVNVDQLYLEGGPYPIKIDTKIPSKLYYKGKLVKKNPKILDLRKGKHKIELENEISGRKTFIIDINGPDEKIFSMNSSFKWFRFSQESTFWNMNFNNQTESNMFLFGFDTSLFIWNFQYFNIDLLGGGFLVGLNKIKSWKAHLLGLTITPLKGITLGINLGPILGDYIRIYDNTENIWITYAGISIGYLYKINNLLGIKLYSSFYYGATNSEKSGLTEKETTPEKGYLFNLGLKLNIEI